MAETRRLDFATPPALLPALARAMLSRRAGFAAPPLTDIHGHVARLRLEPERLRRYRMLCAARQETLPPAFPHVLAAGLHLRMLAHPGFPLRPAGLIHVGQHIHCLAPLNLHNEYRLAAGLRETEPDEKGRRFVLETRLRDGDRDCWRESLTFLARAPRRAREAVRARTPGAVDPPGETLGEIHAAADCGWRYARVSGDWNPIHLTDITARMFGFPRAVAHGMWTLARCLAMLDVDGGVPLSLEAAFKRPLFLPGRAVLHADPAGGPARRFMLCSLGGETVHLEGKVEYEQEA